MANTIDQIAKLIDKKTSGLPTKAKVVRIDGGIVDITLGPGSGVIHHVLVYGDAESLTVGATYPIQWAEREGGYLAPLIVAGSGGSAATAAGGTVVGDNQTIQIVNGVASVKTGGIDQEHLSFTPSLPGHAHPEYAPIDHDHPGVLTEWTESDNTLQDRWGNILLDGNAGRGNFHELDLLNMAPPEYPATGHMRLYTDTSGILSLIAPNGTVYRYLRESVHTKAAHEALGINAGALNGWTARQIAPNIAKDVTLYVNDATGVNDDTHGYSSGTPLATVQYAINRFKGYALSGCRIVVAAGTYIENLNVDGINAGLFDGLAIEGDTCELAGMMFLHGDNYAANNATYDGAGAASITTDNSGAGGRMRLIVTRATTNPNFASGGVTASNYVVLYTGTGLVEYGIYAVSGNVITLATTAAAVALNVAGRGFAITPDVRIYGANVADTYAIEVFQTGVRLKGLFLNGYYGGLRAYVGAIMSERCVYMQRANVSYFGAVHLTSLSFMFSRFDSLNDAHNAVLGYWAAMTVSYAAHANFGKCFAVSIGGYALYCAAGTCYANGARLAGTATGVIATARGYVNAASTNAANWCPTKYSPATSNTFGADGGMITWS